MMAADLSQAKTITDSIVTFAPVVVGGVLAIAGGVGNGLSSHLLRRRSERKERRRKKLEELVELVCKSEHEINRIQRNLFHENKETLENIFPMLDSTETLGVLYFSELESDLTGFISAAHRHLTFILRVYDGARKGAVNEGDVDGRSKAEAAMGEHKGLLLKHAAELMRTFD